MQQQPALDLTMLHTGCGTVDWYLQAGAARGISASLASAATQPGTALAPTATQPGTTLAPAATQPGAALT